MTKMIRMFRPPKMIIFSIFPKMPKVVRSSAVPKRRSGPALMRMKESLLRGEPVSLVTLPMLVVGSRK